MKNILVWISDKLDKATWRTWLAYNSPVTSSLNEASCRLVSRISKHHGQLTQLGQPPRAAIALRNTENRFHVGS